MKELVFKSEKGNPVTTSLLVAEKFRKRHSDVLRAIEGVIAQTPVYQTERNFALSEYRDSTGKSNPTYVITKDGFSVLVMGFTGEKAMRFKWDFIEAFNNLEKSVMNKLPQTFSEALRQLAEQVEENDRQQRLIAEQKPKVIFADAVATSTQSCLVGELAKILRQNGVEMGQNRLFSWLRDNGYLCQYGERRNQPTQRAMEMELFEVKKTTINKPDGSILVTSTTKVTGKGSVYFVNKFLKVTA